MQKVKTCPVCGRQFVADKTTTIYCSKVCYGADSSRKKARRTNIDNQDCMDGMKGIPDKFFDLAIVDPP